jgi:hypothetical protein
MRTSRLIIDSVIFILKNSWPILAISALYLPIQVSLDQSEIYLFKILSINQEEIIRTLIISFPYLFFDTLSGTIYQSVLIFAIWTKLHKVKFTYKSWRDWAILSFPVFFFFNFLIMATFKSGLGIFLFPFIIFLMPYVDLVILFEQKGIVDSFRQNIIVALLLPTPTIIMSIIRLVLIGWLPISLLMMEVPYQARSLIMYSMIVFLVPFDTCFIVLYSLYSDKKLPDGFEGENDFPES